MYVRGTCSMHVQLLVVKDWRVWWAVAQGHNRRGSPSRGLAAGSRWWGGSLSRFGSAACVWVVFLLLEHEVWAGVGVAWSQRGTQSLASWAPWTPGTPGEGLRVSSGSRRTKGRGQAEETGGGGGERGCYWGWEMRGYSSPTLLAWLAPQF